MDDAWLSCKAIPGTFNDEYIVGIETSNGRRHLFVDMALICWPSPYLCSTKYAELKVKVMKSTYGGVEGWQRVILPHATMEGPAHVLVRIADLRAEGVAHQTSTL